MAARTGARRYWLIWAAAIPVALWAMVRAFGLEGGGLMTAAMFLTPWAAIAALFVAGVAVALRNWATGDGLATACLAGAVPPRAIGTETESPAGHETLTVLSANVFLGDADPDALISLVDRYHPDLLSLQELTPSFAAKLRRAGIGRRLPHSVLMAQPKGHGASLSPRAPTATAADALRPVPRWSCRTAGGCASSRSTPSRRT
jgi:endonuclease/exonuclease/phosphatase (EEP) superfamily protein YafD